MTQQVSSLSRNQYMTFKLKLQQKLVIGVIVVVCSLGIVGYIAYKDLDEIKTEVHHVENAYDIMNTILLMRRAEKNYFLYNDRKHLNQIFGYIAILEKSSHKFSAERICPMGLTSFRSLVNNVQAYKHGIEIILNEYPFSNDTMEQIRKAGRQLYQFVQRLSEKERQNIEALIMRSQQILFLVVWFLLVLGLVAGHFIAKGIVRPLKTIEERTREIIKGNFKPLPEIKTHHEIETLIKAFNRMLRDLCAMEMQADKLATLGTLLSGVAHELNNPLSNISSSSQILQEEIEKDDLDFKRKLLDQIQQQCDKSKHIIQSLLEYTRPKKFETEPVNLKLLAVDTIQLLAGHIPARLEIVTHIPDELEILADKQKIQQAFLNLLSNAIDAIGENGGTISILAKRSKGEGTVNVEFHDTGKGIEPNHLSHIFDPFFSTKAVGQGTGMGLFITRQIIDRIGGQITVESVPGEGTTFKLALPCKQ